jgi:hypothetical protein
MQAWVKGSGWGKEIENEIAEIVRQLSLKRMVHILEEQASTPTPTQ